MVITGKVSLKQVNDHTSHRNIVTIQKFTMTTIKFLESSNQPIAFVALL